MDLVLLSHGDLAHSGLYAYAYSRWELKAPTYTSLPVQAMARMAALEDVEGVRDEEDVDPQPEEYSNEEGTEMAEDTENATPKPSLQGKYVATTIEVHEAFDSINTLRYSQPCHLQGEHSRPAIISSTYTAQEDVKASPLRPSTPGTPLAVPFGRSARPLQAQSSTP